MILFKSSPKLFRTTWGTSILALSNWLKSLEKVTPPFTDGLKNIQGNPLVSLYGQYD